MANNPPKTAEEFEQRFDAGEDMGEFLASLPRRSREPIKRVNVDFPEWMVRGLDAEASRIGISRQAVIKTVVAHHLDREKMISERTERELLPAGNDA